MNIFILQIPVYLEFKCTLWTPPPPSSWFYVRLWVFSFPSRFVISIQPDLISETLRDMSGSPL